MKCCCELWLRSIDPFMKDIGRLQVQTSSLQCEIEHLKMPSSKLHGQWAMDWISFALGTHVET
jgi:hypothetical protein